MPRATVMATKREGSEGKERGDMQSCCTSRSWPAVGASAWFLALNCPCGLRPSTTEPPAIRAPQEALTITSFAVALEVVTTQARIGETGELISPWNVITMD